MICADTAHACRSTGKVDQLKHTFLSGVVTRVQHWGEASLSWHRSFTSGVYCALMTAKVRAIRLLTIYASFFWMHSFVSGHWIQYSIFKILSSPLISCLPANNPCEICHLSASWKVLGCKHASWITKQKLLASGIEELRQTSTYAQFGVRTKAGFWKRSLSFL